MWHVRRIGVVYTGFWWEDLREHHWEDQGVDGRIILKLTFRMRGWRHELD
jgi:hypothetical protein